MTESEAAGGGRPGTADDGRPGTADDGRPGTADDGRPGTAADDERYGWDGDRFVVRIGDEEAGHIAVRQEPGRVVALHTQTDPARQGQGIAGRLTQALLDDLRATDRLVLPECSYVRSWLGKHPEYQDVAVQD